jgi:hypothetical protein
LTHLKVKFYANFWRCLTLPGSHFHRGSAQKVAARRVASTGI